MKFGNLATGEQFKEDGFLWIKTDTAYDKDGIDGFPMNACGLSKKVAGLLTYYADDSEVSKP
jgi:hypothetical protein